MLFHIAKILLVMCALSAHFAFANVQLSIDDFLAPPEILNVSLSPDSRYLASLRNNGDRRYVVIQDMLDDNKIVSEFGDEVVRPQWIHWANNEKLIIGLEVPVFRNQVRADLKKKSIREIEYPRVYRAIAYAPGESEYVELLDDKSALNLNRVLSRVSHYLPQDKEHILLQTYYKGTPALFKSNIYTGESELIVRGGNRTVAFESDKFGNVKYRYDYIRSNKEYIIYAYQEDAWVEYHRIEYNLDDESGTIDSDSLLGILEDGTFAYIERNPKTGFYEILKVTREGNHEVLASRPNADIYALIANNRTGEAIGYAVIEHDSVRNHYFDEALEAEANALYKLVTKVGSKNYQEINMDNPSYGVIRTSSLSDMGTYYLFDRKNFQLKFLGHSHKTLLPKNVGISVITHYRAKDGKNIPAYAILPSNFDSTKKYPLVVLPHGGPQSRDFADNFDAYAQFIATRGYIVIKPNFRGSIGYGIDFEEAGYKQWGQLMQQDIEDAARSAIRDGIADPDKVCIVGGSFGGYAALMGALNKDKLFKCAVSLNGVTDLPRQLKSFEKEFSGYDKVINNIYERMGDPTTDIAMLEKYSPVNRAAEMHAPILLVGGKEDTRVPFSQQKVMYRALKKHKKEVETLYLDDATHHIFSRYLDRKAVYEATEKFLEKYLGS
ncbi:alpha/beta hydrolase family protein [Saccharophagus degradans]|uniref:Prolyl oligopeptidase family serine peptidase n=1 Tax=Saccharophagus degradans TaxID=86304 RepID=A0AAW7XDX0_9GAMM|nr:alpha/beta fold hydrolase [Saccharophagus degradans]MDO6424738.1 prolyl oligopeptidase family serine peptidase [Saccharophagus degradans]MDO6609510.1 prolyl oligopeptidase family serine peptidase [Saccharophagus degradans]